MAGILEIRRGSSGISLADGEFYLNKGINAVQIGSGSSVLTLVPLNKSISGDIILNGNIYANNLTGSGALSTTITATGNVGGINSGDSFGSGTDFTTLWQDLLAPYVSSSMSNLTLYNGASPLSSADREVGSNFIFNIYQLNSTTDSNGAYAINASVTMSGATNGTNRTDSIGTLAATKTANLGSTVTPSRNTVGNITFTINARTPDNTKNITPLVLNYGFKFRNILAASATDVTDNTSAQTVYNTSVDSELTDSVAWTADCTNDNADTTKFTYIIYPSTYPDLTTISKGLSDVRTAFTNVGTYTITNGSSVSTTYKIYKSTQPGAYRLGDKLTIS
jgi:hypothetical protein